METSLEPTMSQHATLPFTVVQEAILDSFKFVVAASPFKPVVFHTECPDLWDVYLSAFPEDVRQQYNCRCCKHFIERFGNLVYIDANGVTTPLFWRVESAPEIFQPIFRALHAAVAKARVVGAFGHVVHAFKKHKDVQTPKDFLGTLGTNLDYKHFGIPGFAELVEIPDFRVQDTHEFLGKLIAKHITHIDTLDKVLAMAATDSLGRMPHTETVRRLRGFLLAVKSLNGAERSNYIWSMASAQNGYFIGRLLNSSVDSLMEDLSNKEFPDAVAIKRYKDNLSSENYQRPKAEATETTVLRFKRLLEELGLVSAFVRRRAFVGEIPMAWKPAALVAGQNTPESDRIDPFAKLGDKYAKQKATSVTKGPEVVKSMRAFIRDLLPLAEKVEVLLPGNRGYGLGCFTTHQYDDAGLLLKWDSEEQRNPFSNYVYQELSSPMQWGLAGQSRYLLKGITLAPQFFYNQDLSTFDDDVESLFFVIGQGGDTRNPSSCIFPETVREDLFEFRKAVETLSGSNELQPVPEGESEAVYLATNKHTMAQMPITLIVTFNNVETYVKISTWA